MSPTSKVVPLDPGERYEPTSLSIEAETADAVYERLLDTLGDRAEKLLNVTCVVRSAKSAEKPPTNFTKVNLPEQWLKDVVDWWQKAAPSLVATGDAPFNHGERLYGSGTHVGALDVAAGKLGSTKAMGLARQRRRVARCQTRFPRSLRSSLSRQTTLKARALIVSAISASRT